MTIEGFLIQILKIILLLWRCFVDAQVVVLTLKGTSFSEAVLSVPADGSDKQSTYPLFTWSKDTIGDATLFDLEIPDINFTEIVAPLQRFQKMSILKIRN
jgi:hypothetical protein